MNPAGFTYGGAALRDAVLGGGLPYVEVHMTNQAKRGIESATVAAAEGSVMGFGIRSYVLGLEAMLGVLGKAPR